MDATLSPSSSGQTSPKGTFLFFNRIAFLWSLPQSNWRTSTRSKWNSSLFDQSDLFEDCLPTSRDDALGQGPREWLRVLIRREGDAREVSCSVSSFRSRSISGDLAVVVADHRLVHCLSYRSNESIETSMNICSIDDKTRKREINRVLLSLVPLDTLAIESVGPVRCDHALFPEDHCWADWLFLDKGIVIGRSRETRTAKLNREISIIAFLSRRHPFLLSLLSDVNRPCPLIRRNKETTESMDDDGTKTNDDVDDDGGQLTHWSRKDKIPSYLSFSLLSWQMLKCEHLRSDRNRNGEGLLCSIGRTCPSPLPSAPPFLLSFFFRRSSV